MTISLQKGGRLSLSKEAPGLDEVIVGLGWDTRSSDGADFDLDASVFLLNAAGKCASERDFIFYNQMRSEDGSVEHTGDNRTGEGEGDDEQVIVRLNSVRQGVEKIAITVTIHDAAARIQNFGMVSNAFVRIVDARNNKEVVRYDLTEDFSVETALIFGELYRKDGEWRFAAVGQGYSGGLAAMAKQYGLDAA